MGRGYSEIEKQIMDDNSRFEDKRDIMENTFPVQRPIRLLTAILVCTANITFLKIGPVSASFFIGLLLISLVYSKFPNYIRVEKDMMPFIILNALSFIGLLLSPVTFDGSSFFTSIQLVYWFLIANIISNVSPVIKDKLFIKAVLAAMFVIGLIFMYKRGEEALLSENESSFIVVVLWPIGFLLFKKWTRLVYIFLAFFLLFLIGSRSGLLIMVIQLVGFYLIKKLESKSMMRLLLFFLVGYFLISNSNVRLFIAERVFPDDKDMQMVIETPEIALQMDKSWVQRRIQQEKCKQVAENYPILGIGPLNLVRYNFDINVSKIDVDSRVLANQYGRSEQRSSHNAYFQLLAENGFVGISLVLLAFVKLFYKYYKKRTEDDNCPILMSSMIGLFINLFMVSGFWGTNTWLMLGLLSGYIRNNATIDENTDSFE